MRRTGCLIRPLPLSHPPVVTFSDPTDLSQTSHSQHTVRQSRGYSPLRVCMSRRYTPVTVRVIRLTAGHQTALPAAPAQRSGDPPKGDGISVLSNADRRGQLRPEAAGSVFYPAVPTDHGGRLHSDRSRPFISRG